MNHAVRPERVGQRSAEGRVDRRRVQRLAQLCLRKLSFRGIAKFRLRWQLSVAYSRHARAHLRGLGAQICHPLHIFGPDILLQRGRISRKENSYVSFSTFYANTCISTTIVAFYMNKSSGRARGEVLRIFG